MAVRPRRLVLVSAWLMAGALLVGPRPSRAQDQDTSAPSAETGATAERAAPSAPAQRPGIDRAGVVRLLLQANPMLWPLVICSIVTLAYVLERALALRRDRVIPREFAD